MKVYWPMTKEFWEHEYLPITFELINSARANDPIRHEAAKERMKALPGFPHHAHPTEDIIIPRWVNPESPIITFGSNLGRVY